MMQQTEKLRRRATGGLLLSLAGMALCGSSLSVMPNQIIETYGLVGGQQGLMTSLTMVGSLAAVLVVPFVQGRARKTAMLALGLLVQVAAMVLTGAAPSFLLLLAGCALMGACGGWIDTYSNAAMVDIHQEDSARYMGLLHGCYGVGSILSPLILQGLLFLTGWRNVYYLVAGLALVVALVFIWATRTSREVFRQSAEAEQRLSRAQLKAFFTDAFSVFATISMLFYGASQISLTSWLVRYMAVEYGAEALGSLAISLFWLCVTLSRFIAPAVRIDPLKLVAGGMALTAALHTAGVLSGQPVVMVAMVAASGLTSGFAIPMLIHAVVSRHPSGTALATTVVMLAMRVTQILVPLLLGIIAAVSMQASMLVTAACAVLTAAAGALAVCAQAKRPVA